MTEEIKDNNIDGPIEVKEANIEKPKNQIYSKKQIAWHIINGVFLGLSFFASFVLTFAFIGNIDIINRHDGSGILVIFTLPIFIFIFILNILFALPALGLSIDDVAHTKFKDKMEVVLFVFSIIAVLYPVCLLGFLFLYPSFKNGGTTSSESIESISEAMYQLINILKK